MRAAAVLVAAGVVFALPSASSAGLFNFSLERLVDHQCDDTPANRKRLAEACDVEKVDQVVCINDFVYQPPIITPRVGDTVAWVNIEKCADPKGSPINIVESIVANVAGVGCDTHHEVVTLPDESSIIGDDSLDERLCSPHAGIKPNPSLPPLPGFDVVDSACGGPDPEGSTKNYVCHTFQNVGLQHYTCLTNPGHTAVLHGGILVLPKEAPELPHLPQLPEGAPKF